MTRLSRGAPGAALALALSAAAGCGGGQYSTSGYTMLGYFPLDEGWSWRYTNADSSSLYEVTSVGSREVGGVDVVAFEWRFAPEDDLDGGEAEALFETYYRAEGHDLTFHGWSALSQEGEDHLGSFAAERTYDPPVVVAQDGMHVSSSVTTETGGVEWTSTLDQEVDGLQTSGGGLFDGVLKIVLDDPSGECPFVGDWYLGHEYGPVQFRIALDPEDTWLLKRTIFNG